MSNLVMMDISMKVTNNGKSISDYNFNSFPQTVEADNVTSIMTIAKMAVGNDKVFDALNHQFQTFNGIALECSDVVEVRFADSLLGLNAVGMVPWRVKGKLAVENGLGYQFCQISNIGISGNEVRVAFHGTMVM